MQLARGRTICRDVTYPLAIARQGQRACGTRTETLWTTVLETPKVVPKHFENFQVSSSFGTATYEGTCKLVSRETRHIPEAACGSEFLIQLAETKKARSTIGALPQRAKKYAFLRFTPLVFF